MIRRPKGVPTASFDITCLPGSREALEGVDVMAWPVITGKALDLLDEIPEVRAESDEFYRLAHRLWHDVRYLPCDAEGRTVEDVLNVPAVASPLTTLRQLLRVLLSAGSLEKTLLLQRASIDRTLETLSRRRDHRITR